MKTLHENPLNRLAGKREVAFLLKCLKAFCCVLALMAWVKDFVVDSLHIRTVCNTSWTGLRFTHRLSMYVVRS